MAASFTVQEHKGSQSRLCSSLVGAQASDLAAVPKVAPSEKAGTNAIAKTFSPRAKPKRNGAKRFERKSSLRPSGRCCRVDEEGAKAKQKGIQQRDRSFGKIETGELYAT
jgi:hypothetical protein